MDRNRVRRAWDAVAEAYASNRRADGEDAALLAELLAELPPEPTVLDVGCGDGARTLANLPAGSVGLDLSRRGLELARERLPDARLLQADMTAVPLGEDTVDAVTAYHAVFHVPRAEHPAVYREFARVLRPGGYLLATVGTSASETTRPDWFGSGHPMFFSTPGRETTLAQLRQAGFEVVWERSVEDPLGSSALFVLARLSGPAGRTRSGQP